MAYAKKLTKAELISEGITEITKEGRVFKGDKEIFPHWVSNKTTGDYLGITIYERDSENRLIKGKDRVYKRTRKDGTISETLGYLGIPRTIGLHRAIWAWIYDEVPEGMVVDHINNKHSQIEDYYLSNLQLLTPKQNLAKEREESTRQLKCKLNKPRSFYEEKLAKYEALYEEAKIAKNADQAHRFRSNMAQTRARLRYYDSHKQEMNIMTEYQKDLAELKTWKKAFKEQGNKTMWHECITVEKMVKEKGIEAVPIIKHALEVAHRHFRREELQ